MIQAIALLVLLGGDFRLEGDPLRASCGYVTDSGFSEPKAGEKAARLCKKLWGIKVKPASGKGKVELLEESDAPQLAIEITGYGELTQAPAEYRLGGVGIPIERSIDTIAVRIRVADRVVLERADLDWGNFKGELEAWILENFERLAAE